MSDFISAVNIVGIVGILLLLSVLLGLKLAERSNSRPQVFICPECKAEHGGCDRPAERRALTKALRRAKNHR